MNNNIQRLEVTATRTPLSLDVIQPNPAKVGLHQYNFHVAGVGTGFFSYLDDDLEGSGLESSGLESLVWDGQEIELAGFKEQNACFDNGELLGLHLLGEGWEIILNLAIEVKGMNRVGEVTYTPISDSLH